MDTNYKVVKLTNGESIICEMKEYANEKYIIKTPLKMETVDEEMIDRDKINDILEEFIKTNKSKYH